ncbi:hypothetical protein M8J77_010933 [Diaphorina citri]|nr:hypothetical protein M8J77_010933 [Diaphorina citri]
MIIPEIYAKSIQATLIARLHRPCSSNTSQSNPQDLITRTLIFIKLTYPFKHVANTSQASPQDHISSPQDNPISSSQPAIS